VDSSSSSTSTTSSIPASSFPLDFSALVDDLVLSENDISRVVIVDLGGALSGYSQSCLAYRDLSETGNFADAARSLFDTLRWAESVTNASLVVLPYVASEYIDQLQYQQGIVADEKRSIGNDEGSSMDMCSNSNLAPGLADRMFRAASGRFVNIKIKIGAPPP